MALSVLVADKLSDTAIEELGSLGAKVVTKPELKADDLPAAIGDAEILVVRSTRVTRETIEAGDSLALIIRAGAGVNTIDIEAASERGVAVANCPGKNTAAVAELAIGLMLAADRRIPAATQDLVEGHWRKKEYSSARGLMGRTIGIVGLGAIGQAVAVRAHALEMHVCAWSRSLTPERAEELGVEYFATPEELAACSDVVSVHLASTPETAGLIGAEFFGAMREGSIFVNTSRGEVVDQAALGEAVATRGIKVALDVYAPEPAGAEAPFGDADFASALAAATPHIGASTSQASEAIAAEVVRIVRAYVETGTPINTVNVRARAEEDVTLVVRHHNKVGVLAGVLDELRNEGINVEEMQNTIFSGGTTASCSLKLDRAPDSDHLKRIQRGEHVIQVNLK